MLVITVDIVPGGYEPLRRTIGSMQIANVSDLADVSDYAVDATESANPLSGTALRNRKCTVRAHNRRQSIWVLLAKASGEILKEDSG